MVMGDWEDVGVRNCKHDKVFSKATQRLVYPPNLPWICRKCFAEGRERVRAVETDEYTRLKNMKALGEVSAQ